MSNYRKAAIGIGALWIFATFIGVLGGQLTGAILDAPDYLQQIAAHQSLIVLGVIMKTIGACACAGIAIALYPVLEQHNKGLALGSVAFRLLESVFYMIGAIGLMTLVALSQKVASAGPAAAAAFEVPAAVVMAAADWAGLLGVIPFTLGGFMYYVVFFQSRLIPRWLSVWGCVAVVSSLVAIVLSLFGVLVPFSTPFILLQAPIGVQELVLGVWLIVKGFSPAAVAARSARSVLVGARG
jgi:hypothetical protein